MYRLHRRPAVVAGFIAASLAAVGTSAQSERVSVRMAPRPDQTVRMTMVQELNMEIAFDAASAPPAVAGPMTLSTRTTIAMSQKTGSARPDGTVEAEIAYDDIRVEGSMNGQALPATDLANVLRGLTMVVVYDKDGSVVDVTSPTAPGVTPEAIRQLINGFYGVLPAASLAVGETTSAPLDFDLPIGIPGAPPMKMDGEVRLKLVSIGDEAGRRSARFESTLDGKVVSGLPGAAGAGQASMNFTMTGDGTWLIDMDRGVMRTGTATNRFDGTVATSAGAAPAPPRMRMTGTLTVTTTSD